MNKLIYGVMGAILVCGEAFLTSCSSDDSKKDDSKKTVYTDDYEKNIANKIVGKWIDVEIDGKALPTNVKGVITIESFSKGYFSSSFGGEAWVEREPFEIKIKKDTVSWVMMKESVVTRVQHVINSVTDLEMNTSTHVVSAIGDSVVKELGPMSVRYVKLPHDYRPDIVGLWEGKVVSDSSKFDDGGVHRWEYRDDGTYVYYRLVKDKWVAVGGPVSHYYVDGTLLATRWQNDGETQENREWWEIESIEDGVMNWSALRIGDDGAPYAASFSMTKVNDL